MSDHYVNTAAVERGDAEYSARNGARTSDDGALKSVHWLTGMLLTPQHFERQDQFIEAAARWAMRYAMPGAGLLGGGLRVDPRTTDPARYDPRLEVADDGETVRLSLLTARGVTAGGDVIDVAEEDVVRASVARTALAGVTEADVHVVRLAGREEDPSSTGLDAVNPHQPALRRARYRLVVGLAPEQRAQALAVGRIRRVSETLGFDRDGSYIPACAAVLAHSRLYAGWSRLRDGVADLAERYGELHRAVAAFAERLAERGVDVRGDLDTLAFVERAVLSLDDCAYALIDAARPPGPVFADIERMGRRVALALDLSAATRLFLHAISTADAGYEVLLDEERQALARRRGTAAQELDGGDVGRALARAEDTVRRVRELGAAVEGKYVDFRLNRAVDALRFVLERGGEGFYTAVATPAHPRRDGDLLTFDFSPLQLPGRQEYRVLLVGDVQGESPWRVGDAFPVDVWVNPGSGGGRPLSFDVRCEIPGQRNFGVTFDGPGELGTISALRVTVHQQGHRLRRAALYQRARGVVADVAVVAVASAAPSAAPAFVPAARVLGATGDAGGPASSTPVVGTALTTGAGAAPASDAISGEVRSNGGPTTGAPTPPPVEGVPVIKRIPLRRPPV